MKWILIVLVILVVLLLGCVGFCYFSFQAGMNVVMAPINDLVENLNQNDEVKAKLGSPITQISVFDQGKFNSNISNNEADVEITVKGPNGSADVSGKLRKDGSKWVPIDVEVTFEDSSSIWIRN